MEEARLELMFRSLGLCSVGDRMLLEVLKQGCHGVSFVFYQDLGGMASSVEDECEGGIRSEACRPVRRRVELSRQKRRSIRNLLAKAADLGDELDVDSEVNGGI